MRRPRVEWCWVCAKRFRTRAQVAKRCPECRTKSGREKRLTERRWPASFLTLGGAA